MRRELHGVGYVSGLPQGVSKGSVHGAPGQRSAPPDVRPPQFTDWLSVPPEKNLDEDKMDVDKFGSPPSYPLLPSIVRCRDVCTGISNHPEPTEK